MNAKKFRTLSADEQIGVLALQAWRLRRKRVRFMKALEHIDVLTLSDEALGKYLDLWRDVVKEVERYAFAQWLTLRTEQRGLDPDKLSPRKLEQLVEESRPEWKTTPDSIKTKREAIGSDWGCSSATRLSWN